MKDNKPSATACMIARSTLFLSRDPVLAELIPEPSARLCEQFVHARSCFARWLDALINRRAFRPLITALERATIPGIKLHYALRKRYLEETARDALRGGLRQVVIIGAGFDTLALRLCKAFPETRFFEVDHPATQGVKKRVLEKQHSLTGNLQFISLDLAQGNLQETLLSCPGYQAKDDTLFIAEGLLMYLAPAEIDSLLQFIRHHSGAKSRFAFTFMEIQTHGRIGFRESSRAVDAWLRLRGESFKWGSTRRNIQDFLVARSFAAREIISSEILRNKYLNRDGLGQIKLADGECICVAEFN
jgi:methyltransferase (TIGR00027 family)